MVSRTKRGVAASAVALLGCVLPWESASAHCRVAGDPVGSYRFAFPHPDPNLVGPISVYLSDGALSSIEHTGLSAEQFLPILRATLSELNPHLDIATLQYAGVHSVDPAIAMDGSLVLTGFPNGITVGSFECEGVYRPCEAYEAPGMAGCNRFPAPADMMAHPGTALVSLSPPNCASLASPSWSPGGTDYRDPIHVLLHEFGHALGLLHSNFTTAECQAQGGQEDGDDLPNTAVMWPIVQVFGEGRRLLRDDIEALGAFWGTSDPSSLWYWHDPEPFADPFVYPDPSGCGLAPAHGTSGVPVSISSAVDGFESDVSLLALTDASDQVRVLEGSSSGFPPVDTAELVDPGGTTTLHPLGMALGQSGADPVPFVAWLAEETRVSRAVTLRWAVRPPGEEWEPTNAVLEDLVSEINRRIAAGFDPTTGYFLVTAVTGSDTAVASPTDGARILIVTVDIAGNQVATSYLDDTPAYDVGSPACIAATGVCIIPIMTSELGGPGYAWLEVDIADDGAATRLAAQSQNTLEGASGAPGLALWPGAGGAGIRGVLGGRRIASPAWPIDGSKWDTDLYDNNGWPLRVGSVKPPGGDAVFPIVARRIGPALYCGDNIINCDEECDDGNDVDGDGCTRCVLDAVPLDSGSGMGGGDSSGSRETDGSGGAGANTGGGGCGCRTQPPMTAPLLVILGAFGAIRRRFSRGALGRFSEAVPAPRT